jgi:hypothetical protein
MIIGMDFFNGSCFNTNIPVGQIYRAEMQDCIIDEVKIDENITVSNLSTKQEWGLDTKLLGKFQNSLEAGNLDNKGMPIEFIIIKKRRKSDLTWSKIKEFNFDKAQKIYEFEDKYVEAGEEYEFALFPVTSNIEGKYTIADIVAEYDDTWLMDKENSVRLIYNLQYGDFDNIIPSTDIETMGGKYPTIAYAGELDYKRGNIQCLLVAKESMNGITNVRQEKLLRKNVISFLTNKKPKLLKDNAGLYMVVSVKDVKELPQNDLKGQYGVSFNITEIADTDTQSLKDNGLY